jgi:hypothetical protein
VDIFEREGADVGEGAREERQLAAYASLRAAVGDHPVYSAEQLGHEDPGFTFRVYQRAAKRRDRLSGSYLDGFDRGLEWVAMGSESPDLVRLDAKPGEGQEPGTRMAKP